jgi:hypothetical protein
MTRLAINALARDRTTPPASKDDETSSTVALVTVTLVTGLSVSV